MSMHVGWDLELRVQDGRENDFRALVEEMVTGAQENEPGALVYEVSVGADGRQCHFHERYADAAAAMTHLGNFGEKYAGRFMEVFTVDRFVVYGSPDAAIKDALAAFSPTYMEPVAGFSR